MVNSEYAIGIDLGGTKIEIGIINNQGEILKRSHCKTNVAGGYSAILKELIDTLNTLIATGGVTISSIGVGIAGQVKQKTGEVMFAPNLEWRNVPLQNELSKSLHLPVVVTNDVRAATIGEWTHGEGKECQNLVCIYIGTGIGGGIISNGQILSGSTNTAGEIGHMILDINGPYCTCGSKGCWEALAGGWAIAKKARQAVTDHPKEGAKLMELTKGLQGAITANTVAEAFNQNDPLAKQIMDDVARAMITGSINIVNTINPAKLIFGGGIITGFPHLLEAIEKGVHKHALKASTEQLTIVRAKLGNDAGIIGAANLSMQIK